MLTPWKESYDQPREHIKKQRHDLPTKVHLVKAMVFPVVMYGCESWTINKAECRRTDAFELWCWRRLLRVSWTAKRSNQSILKEIIPGCSLVFILQYFGHLMRRAYSFEKTLVVGKDWWQEEKGMTEDETWVWVNSGSWWWTGRPGMLRLMWSQRDTTERLN